MSQSESTRPRGVTVFPMPQPVSGPYDRYAVCIRDNGSGLAVRMIHTEGVAYAVTDDKPWTWNDYDPTCPKFTPDELVTLAAGVEGVDLADWVRKFGSRLESNFGMVYYWANQD